MKILVLNCGSSSLKYQLIDMDNSEVLAKGNYERIGEKEAFLTHKINGEKFIYHHGAENHESALIEILEELVNKLHPAISTLKEIQGVGHRVVHGGEIFKGSELVTQDVIDKIVQCGEFAPLHNFAAVQGINACIEELPGVPNVVVFDTAFHQTMPKERYIYPIPYEYYEKYGIRKYGAHGTSHDYVSKRVAELMDKDIKTLKIITCHLGQGASICAIKEGKCVDTSMGLTPVAGIPMVTRSGDLDPSVVTYIMEKENIAPKEMTAILNKKSGISAISKMAPDFRTIEGEYLNSVDAKLAVDKFSLTISEYIARYCAVLNGVDVIVFTGGIGENQFKVRESICKNLSFIGLEIDKEINLVKSEEVKISTDTSKVAVYVIPTDEEMEIAKQTVNIINK
ncbi:MAG: acetate kinase [Clostridia bacterium]|nr:acetate kinase [Clostridia bacterium]